MKKAPNSAWNYIPDNLSSLLISIWWHSDTAIWSTLSLSCWTSPLYLNRKPSRKVVQICTYNTTLGLNNHWKKHPSLHGTIFQTTCHHYLYLYGDIQIPPFGPCYHCLVELVNCTWTENLRKKLYKFVPTIQLLD